MGYMPSGAVSLPDSARFLKAAVIVLVESNEESAARLLINHFLKKAEKTAFLDRLPKNIVKSLKITREKS
jgi:hypothetical protein